MWCGTVQGLFLTKALGQITENCIVCNIPNLLKPLKMCGSRSQEGLVHVDRPGGEGGEELTGFLFLHPTLLSLTPWVPGRPLLPPL